MTALRALSISDKRPKLLWNRDCVLSKVVKPSPYEDIWVFCVFLKVYSSIVVEGGKLLPFPVLHIVYVFAAALTPWPGHHRFFLLELWVSEILNKMKPLMNLHCIYQFISVIGILHADQPVSAFETNSLMIGCASCKSTVAPKMVWSKTFIMFHCIRAKTHFLCYHVQRENK
jgi:hypothetical protein